MIETGIKKAFLQYEKTSATHLIFSIAYNFDETNDENQLIKLLTKFLNASSLPSIYLTILDLWRTRQFSKESMEKCEIQGIGLLNKMTRKHENFSSKNIHDDVTEFYNNIRNNNHTLGLKDKVNSFSFRKLKYTDHFMDVVNANCESDYLETFYRYSEERF